MCTILMPVDGSENSDRAVRFLAGLYKKLAPASLHLLHVQAPAVPDTDEPRPRDGIEQERGTAESALHSATALLDAAGIPYTSALERGYVPATIVRYAVDNRCDAIIMGTRGMGSNDELLGSIARQIILLASVPVTLVK